MVEKKRPGAKIPEGILNEPKYLYRDLLKVPCDEVELWRGGAACSVSSRMGGTGLWGGAAPVAMALPGCARAGGSQTAPVLRQERTGTSCPAQLSLLAQEQLFSHFCLGPSN